MTTTLQHRKTVLQEARKSVKLSQRQFAEKIGKKYSFVARHELGQWYMTVETVCSWAKGADMDPVILFAQLVNEPTGTSQSRTENGSPAVASTLHSRTLH